MGNSDSSETPPPRNPIGPPAPARPEAGGSRADVEPPPGLGRLRRDIDAIDEQIVDLLTQRHRMVQKVLAIKRAHHLAIYHPSREENLISLRRDQAARAGLDPDHVEELFRSILRQSRVRQTVQINHTGIRPGAKVLLVGGKGQMGQYLARRFSGARYEVRILDIDDWPNAKALCDGIDLALVCVPIDRTVQVIHELGSRLPRQCVLADITSVKKVPLDAMLLAHAGPVAGFHPLFGPATTTMDQQIMAFVPGRMPDQCQWIADQWAAWGCVVLPITAEEHDELMAVVQSLIHFATFALGDFLYRRNVNIARTLELSSPIYRLELGMVGRLFAQDPVLYADIIFASSERRALLLEFLEALGSHRSMLESGDKTGFRSEFRRIAEWFGLFCEQARRESNFLIEKLVERF